MKLVHTRQSNFCFFFSKIPFYKSEKKKTDQIEKMESSTVEKNMELNKEHKLFEALMKLSKESTQESQRLHALKLAWVSRIKL